METNPKPESRGFLGGIPMDSLTKAPFGGDYSAEKVVFFICPEIFRSGDRYHLWFCLFPNMFSGDTSATTLLPFHPFWVNVEEHPRQSPGNANYESGIPFFGPLVKVAKGVCSSSVCCFTTLEIHFPVERRKDVCRN